MSLPWYCVSQSCFRSNRWPWKNWRRCRWRLKRLSDSRSWQWRSSSSSRELTGHSKLQQYSAVVVSFLSERWWVQSQIIAINNNDNLTLFSCGLMNKEQYVVQFHISVSPDTKINTLNTMFWIKLTFFSFLHHTHIVKPSILTSFCNLRGKKENKSSTA